MPGRSRGPWRWKPCIRPLPAGPGVNTFQLFGHRGETVTVSTLTGHYIRLLSMALTRVRLRVRQVSLRDAQPDLSADLPWASESPTRTVAGLNPDETRRPCLRFDWSELLPSRHQSPSTPFAGLRAQCSENDKFRSLGSAGRSSREPEGLGRLLTSRPKRPPSVLYLHVVFTKLTIRRDRTGFQPGAAKRLFDSCSHLGPCGPECLRKLGSSSARTNCTHCQAS